MGLSSVLRLVPRYISEWRYLRIAITLLGFATTFSSCSEKTTTFNGKALGTTWTVKIRASRYLDRSVLKDEIISTIEEAEKILSHWRPDAELYQFNQALTSNPITVHPLLHELLLHARKVHDESAGAFDPTIAPIVNLWGFGPVESTRTSFPSAQEIQEAQSHVGIQLLEILPENQVRKRQPTVQVDLSSSAKGEIIDQVCEMLHRRGLTDHLVEIGGEIRAGSGKWKVALEDGTSSPENLTLFHLQNSAVATSGTYRLNKPSPDAGKPSSHLLDPRTGRPIKHSLVAVNVVASTARVADAFATAFMILGPSEGPALAKKMNMVARFHIEEENSSFAITSPAYDKLLH